MYLNGISSVCNVKCYTDKDIVHVFQMEDLLFCLLFFIEHYYYPFIYSLLHYLIDFYKLYVFNITRGKP